MIRLDQHENQGFPRAQVTLRQLFQHLSRPRPSLIAVRKTATYINTCEGREEAMLKDTSNTTTAKDNEAQEDSRDT